MSDKVIDAKLMWLWYQGARTEHVRKHWFVEEVVRPLLLRVHILPVHAEEVLPVHTPGVELLLRRTQLLRNITYYLLRYKPNKNLFFVKFGRHHNDPTSASFDVCIMNIIYL